LLSGLLSSPRSTHELVFVGFLLVSVPGILAGLVGVIVSNLKSMCLTIVILRFAHCVAGLAMLAENKILEQWDVVQGSLELFGKVSISCDQLAKGLLVG
jgi:hypothetical protein